jgi:hypothetical protein
VPPHPIVAKLTGAAVQAGQAADIPDVVSFVGFLGETFKQPTGDQGGEWQMLYLNAELRTWLLVENSGIVHTEKITDDSTPSGNYDMVWVNADTAVGIGRGSQSSEARFLTGEFTRAGDFDGAPASGGTIAASTGVFCEARTAGCCNIRTK